MPLMCFAPTFQGSSIGEPFRLKLGQWAKLGFGRWNGTNWSQTGMCRNLQIVLEANKSSQSDWDVSQSLWVTSWEGREPKPLGHVVGNGTQKFPPMRLRLRGPS